LNLFQCVLTVYVCNYTALTVIGKYPKFISDSISSISETSITTSFREYIKLASARTTRNFIKQFPKLLPPPAVAYRQTKVPPRTNLRWY
ncbi:MAG TPA: hypothetical protein V6C97_13110, partial [Oculatellaceae cyanobacterium]